VASHLIPALLMEGAQIHGADVSSEDPFEDPQYHHTVCDIRRPADVQSLLTISEPDAVIHLAAQSHVPSAWENPERTWRINVMGTLHLLRACAAQPKPPRFLMISTGEVYGRPTRLPVKETAPLRPRNPYAASKAAAEIMVRQMSDAGQVPAIVVRPFNHTGPGQTPDFVCASFAEQIAQIETGDRQPILKVGDLSPERDFLDVRDVVRAYHRILCRGRIGKTYNIATGRPHSIQWILERLLERSTANILVETDPDRLRPTDTPIIAGDPTLVEQDTGWEARIPFEKTLSDLLEYSRITVRRDMLHE
jgi:GDP-4-dehydro-6-deoxy-D-mannose reductase